MSTQHDRDAKNQRARLNAQRHNPRYRGMALLFESGGYERDVNGAAICVSAGSVVLRSGGRYLKLASGGWEYLGQQEIAA